MNIKRPQPLRHKAGRREKIRSPAAFYMGRLRGPAGGLLFFLFFPGVFAFSSPLYSPTWGFRIDLPEGYEYTGGDGKNRFSFQNEKGANFDLAVYPERGKTMKALVDETNRRLGNQGDVAFFEYGDKQAALIELQFPDPAAGDQGGRGSAPVIEGWGLCVEMENTGTGGGTGEGTSGGPARPGSAGKTGNSGNAAGDGPPLLLALAYGQAGKNDLISLHLSALDSIAPSEAERRFPGPVMSFGYPRGELRKIPLAGLGVEALCAENDAEAAQALIDREFAILRGYLFSPQWREAWIRFYRLIYRDSWERLADAAFQLERYWNAGPGGTAPPAAEENRLLAGKVLAWVQSFAYERDLMGSDLVNLVSAAFEGRGDCDSRALLWAMVLAQADIPSAIMVSQNYSHAMGLADLEGPGARFDLEGKKWLVAETTAPVDLGLIGKEMSDIESWTGVNFE
jgi:hypothetical protein